MPPAFMTRMTIAADQHADDQADYLQYRSLSLLAVTSFGLGILSLAALVLPPLLFLPAIGILMGYVAVRSIRRRREELAGAGLAWTGLIVSLLIFLGGTTASAVSYLTEVPEGYQRISYLELQPDRDRPDLPVSQRAIDLNDQKVFVKGYIFPDKRGARLTQFVMVPDMGTCCFGGQPKLTDMIEVTLKEPLNTQYSYQRHRLGGVLKVDTQLKPISGLEGVYFRLEADYLDGKFSE